MQGGLLLIKVLAFSHRNRISREKIKNLTKEGEKMVFEQHKENQDSSCCSQYTSWDLLVSPEEHISRVVHHREHGELFVTSCSHWAVFSMNDCSSSTTDSLCSLFSAMDAHIIVVASKILRDPSRCESLAALEANPRHHPLLLRRHHWRPPPH